MRRHLLGACAAVPLVLLMAVAGCARSDGGSKVASVSGTASPTASASGASSLSAKERALKFAQCMRDHGVPMEDPQFDGDKIEVQIGGAGAPVDKSKVDAAQEACKEWSPIGGPGGAKPDPQMLENMRKQAQCMRDNGVENFPDPSTDGGIRIDGSIGEDPDFDAAQEKCMKDMPKGGEGAEAVDERPQPAGDPGGPGGDQGGDLLDGQGSGQAGGGDEFGGVEGQPALPAVRFRPGNAEPTPGLPWAPSGSRGSLALPCRREAGGPPAACRAGSDRARGADR